jgi:hypothetical protein
MTTIKYQIDIEYNIYNNIFKNVGVIVIEKNNLI